ncbi:MAG: hypothetical protein Q8K99_02820, partial [Actinomycetota bacterium]|nr:hypothetical protein [Actinomycetota bacterium]
RTHDFQSCTFSLSVSSPHVDKVRRGNQLRRLAGAQASIARSGWGGNATTGAPAARFEVTSDIPGLTSRAGSALLTGVADLAALRDPDVLFGDVASPPPPTVPLRVESTDAYP